jgi:hypothetical protein
VGAGVLFALTLPGLVILLVVVAAVEHAWSRVGRRSVLLRRHRHALSAGGLDVFSAALVPGRTVDLDEQLAREVRRDVIDDGAPPFTRIDLDSGVAYFHSQETATCASRGRHDRCLPSEPSSEEGGER